MAAAVPLRSWSELDLLTAVGTVLDVHDWPQAWMQQPLARANCLQGMHHEYVRLAFSSILTLRPQSDELWQFFYSDLGLVIPYEDDEDQDEDMGDPAAGRRTKTRIRYPPITTSNPFFELLSYVVVQNLAPAMPAVASKLEVVALIEQLRDREQELEDVMKLVYGISAVLNGASSMNNQALEAIHTHVLPFETRDYVLPDLVTLVVAVHDEATKMQNFVNQQLWDLAETKIEAIIQSDGSSMELKPGPVVHSFMVESTYALPEASHDQLVSLTAHLLQQWKQQIQPLYPPELYTRGDAIFADTVDPSLYCYPMVTTSSNSCTSQSVASTVDAYLDGSVHVQSYVNNTPPALNAEFSKLLAGVLARMLPCFERVVACPASPPMVIPPSDDPAWLYPPPVPTQFPGMSTDPTLVKAQWQDFWMEYGFPVRPPLPDDRSAPFSGWGAFKSPTSMRGSQLHASVRVSSIELAPGALDAYEPSKFDFASPNSSVELRHAVAVGVYVVSVENLMLPPTLSFRARGTLTQAPLHGYDAELLTYGSTGQWGDGSCQYFGRMSLHEGRSIVFPSWYWAQVDHLELQDKTRHGSVTLMTVYFMDSNKNDNVPSTNNVPRQQRHWNEQGVVDILTRSLPAMPEIILNRIAQFGVRGTPLEQAVDLKQRLWQVRTSQSPGLWADERHFNL